MLPNRQSLVNGQVAQARLTSKRRGCDYFRMGNRHFIKEWRKHRGLNQEQLADRLHISKGYLSKIESGKRRYDQQFLEAAAEALQCAVPDLLIRDPSDPEGIWSVWDSLPPTQRTQAVEIIKTLKRTG